MLCKAAGLTLILIIGLSGSVSLAEPSRSIFDAEEFWAAHPADSFAKSAWQQGAKWPMGRHSYAVYHDGRIFGFTGRVVPPDQDSAAPARLARAYSERAELEALEVAGLFAFDGFQCVALGDYPALAPRLDLCAKVEVKSKMTSTWSGQAFSVVGLVAGEICACRKALDQGQGEDNTGIFFGEIARQELRRLSKAGSSQAVRDFFSRHYKKKVFQASELLLAAEAWAENKSFDEVLVILDATTKRFGPDLASEQWELCGDLYYQASRENQAALAYMKAGEALYR